MKPDKILFLAAACLVLASLASCSTKFTPTTCTGGETLCGGVCVDLDTDDSNCGACGNACSGGDACVDGVCREVDCPDGETDCDGTCVDLQTDHDNCGACGNACETDAVCSGGSCLDECPAGETECDGDCVDLMSDTSHCGECGVECAVDGLCVGGDCQCLEGEQVCDGACVDVMTDEEHCGRCNFACAIGALCTDGGCACPDGEENCSGACVNTATDPANCGSCGTTCDTGEVCSDGHCLADCPGGETECSGSCVDLTSDRDHCGACDAACPDDRDCASSTCVCRSPLSDCSGACVNLDTDRTNCGSCGTACGTGMVCTSGSCVCTGSLTECSGVCVDLATDGSNCGSCGTACGSGMTCSGGSCVCTGGLTYCSGACVDLATDSSNCGACGTVCGTGMVCASGSCRCGSGLVPCGSSGSYCGPDADGDGVCDDDDVCPGLDDGAGTLFANPNFTTSGGWTASGGALVDTSRSGYAEAGTGYISSAATCAGGALIQDICVPGDYSIVGPLALEFAAKRDESACSYYGCYDGELRLSFDGFERGTEYFGSSWSNQTICLGEAAYGGTITTKFSGYSSASVCDPTETYGFDIDNVGVGPVTDGSCPAPGMVLNGDFSGGATHWRPEATGIAEVVPDGGGDLSGHLVGAAATCESPRLEGKLSIPLLSSLPYPALRIQFAGTSGRNLAVSIRYGKSSVYQLLTGVGTSSWTTQYVCLAGADNQGQVLGVEFESPHPGTCSTAPYREFWIDDLVIVTRTSCP